MCAMHNPPHPGEILREEVIKPLGLSITESAAKISVSRKCLSQIVNGKSGISPDIALRLEMLFGQPAELWLKMQAAYDLWHSRKKNKNLRITPITNSHLAPLR